MSEQLFTRIAKALENTKDDSLVAYRSGLQAMELLDANSIANIPFYPMHESRSFILDARFSNPTAVVTVVVWRGYHSLTDGSTTSTFVAQSHEILAITAPSTTGVKYAGKATPDFSALSALAARAIKVTLASTVVTGTVDIYLRRLA